jgi:hypothetical protein
LTVSVALDAVARLCAITLIRDIQEAYHHHEERVYGARGASDVGLEYVMMGAATVGLNRWTLRLADVPRARVFSPKAGMGIEVVQVAVLEDDLARATKLADILDVKLELVLSAAVCSGLAALSGQDTTLGPFEAPHGT